MAAHLSSKISIILPVLDEQDNLRELLPVLQGSRAAGHEVIVVDGGSRDHSPAIAQALSDRVLSSPCGRARQMNAGAAVAGGEVLLFLHSDTRLPAQWEGQLLSALQRPDRHWGRFDVRLSGARLAFRIIERMINWRSRISGVATGDQAIFCRSSVFHQVGGFPDIALMEDVALSKILRRKSWPVCLSGPAVTSSRRWEQHGLLRTVVLMWRLRLAYFLGAAPQTLHRMYYGKNHRSSPQAHD